VKESVDALRQDIEVLKADGSESSMSRKLLPTTQRLNMNMHTVLKDVTSVKNAFAGFKDDAGVVKSDVGSLKYEVTTLRALRKDVDSLTSSAEALVADVQALKGDLGSLQANNTISRDELVAFRRDYNDDYSHLEREIETLKNGALTLGETLGAGSASSSHDADALQGDIGTLRGEVVGVQGDIETMQGNFARVDATLQRVSGEVQELQNLRRTSEQDLRAQLREEMRNEIRLALAQTPESSSLGTKRKRGDDEVEVFGTDVVPTAVSAAPRPCKRLRTVADFAAASAVGALGAWLGLAYF